MEFEVRKMHPEDVTDWLPLHQQAFAGSLGVQLGKRYLYSFLNWFVTSPGTINLAAITPNQQIVGYVFGGPSEYGTRLNRDLFLNIVVAILTHPWVLVKKGFVLQIPSRLQSLLGRTVQWHPIQRSPSNSAEDSANMFRLVGIGAGPDYQRKGIGRRLITSFEEYVWAAGYDQIQLSVYRDNVSARALYETCGWYILNNKGDVLTYAKNRFSNSQESSIGDTSDR
jgi:ribosomal protein S18 acetylase RimI-like enzyme